MEIVRAGSLIHSLKLCVPVPITSAILMHSFAPKHSQWKVSIPAGMYILQTGINTFSDFPDTCNAEFEYENSSQNSGVQYATLT